MIFVQNKKTKYKKCTKTVQRENNLLNLNILLVITIKKKNQVNKD